MQSKSYICIVDSTRLEYNRIKLLIGVVVTLQRGVSLTLKLRFDPFLSC